MQRGMFPVVLCVVLLGSLPLQTASGQSNDTARLSLDECLHTALANNLDLVSAKKDPLIAEQWVEESKAPFDGQVGADAQYNESEGDGTIRSRTIFFDPPADILEINDVTSDADDLQTSVWFKHALEFGGNYELRYGVGDSSDFRSAVEVTTLLTTTDSQEDFDNLRFTYEMPLLSGFGREATTENILLRRGDVEISREDLRRQAMQTMQAVEDAYWDVLAMREALRISRLALKRAEDLLELNKKKVEVGTLAPIEITEAEAGVASQVEMVIVAEADLETAEDLLLQLMAVPESSQMWEQTLDLTDRPSFVPVKVDLEQAIAAALERRPEIATARQQLRNDELSQRVARNRLKHELTFRAIVTPYSTYEADESRITSTYEQFSNSDFDGSDWQAELYYTYPLRNRKAKADYAIAKLTAEKSDAYLKNIEQDIRVDVRMSVRNLESGLKRVEAASKNVELQQKKLEAEQKKFDNGMSTSFEVLTFQNDLADSELKEIRARLDYVKSLTALERSKGTLLEARGLSLGE